MSPDDLMAFTRAPEFIEQAKVLTDVDFALEPSPADDLVEQRTLASLCSMLDEYQEQSYLLDPSLDALVSPLLATLRAQVRTQGSNLASTRIARLARLVYFVTKVRGAKTIVRFFPHEVSDLSLLVSLLTPATDSAPTATTPSSASAPWELRYLLLLWLSLCVRLPFSLALLAPHTAAQVEHLARWWLARSHGREGDAAAEVLGRYFARADVDPARLVGWCEEELTSEGDRPALALPLLTSLLLVLSTAPPPHLTPLLPRLYALLALLPAPADGRAGAGAARARAKLAGRWAVLALGAAGEGRGDERGEGDGEGEGEVDVDVPEEVEVVVGELIEGLSHPDSLPRYSSAKYLSRLSLLLPLPLASQVLDAVLAALDDALSPAPAGRDRGARGEAAAQGACLAVGEMARRGVLRRLEGAEEEGEVVGRVVECAMQALAYDHLTTLHPIGSSVRDSASYVLWSLSRTLPASALSPRQAQRLAERLLCTACLDRDVSVRRAASAAWQEAVGRWGIFPHGIAILRQVDFFTVSVRHRAFLEAAVAVASYTPYRSAIVSHLVGHQGGTGTAHYDAEIRALAARALGKVVAGAEAEAAAAARGEGEGGEEDGEERGLARRLVREQVDALAQTKDVAKLHGVLLSLAALAEAVEALAVSEREELRRQVFAAVCALHPSTRSLPRNHLVLSAALSALARSAPSASASGSPSAGPPSPTVPPAWSEIVRLACDRSEEAVHAAAGDALRAVSRAVDCSVEIDHLLADLDSRSPTRQQAAALLLGRATYGPEPDPASASVPDRAAPRHSERLPDVVRRLERFVRREGPGCAGSIEARRNGVEALAAVLVAPPGAALADADPSLVSSALEALLGGFSDYTTDQRGDVGSWVRASTIGAFSALVCAGTLLSGRGRGRQGGQGVVDCAVGAMAKQAVERLDGVREAAGRGLMEMWGRGGRADEGGELMRAREVWEGIASEERCDWRDLNWASERILPLLKVPEYRDAVLEGAVLASTAFSSSTPFLDFALLLPPLPSSSSPRDAYTLLSLLSSLYTLGKTHVASNRLFVPLLSLVASLAETGALDEVALEGTDAPEPAQGPKVLRNFLALACSGVVRIKNPARLGAAAKLVTAFLALPSPVARAAAPKLAQFLAHPLPWLRQQTADELFGALSALGLIEQEENDDEGRGGELERLLTETVWASEGAQQPAERVAQLVGTLIVRGV